MSKISVIGGCGRLGLRLSLVAASSEHHVTIVDIDEERINEIKQGSLPFVEKDGEIYLEQAKKKRLLSLSTDYDVISSSEIIVIAIGTPVDSNLNPGIEPVAGVIFDISPHIKKGNLIIFRDTISPAVIERIKVLIEDKTNLKVGIDLYLVFAPELSNEDSNIHDLLKLPQPLGAFDERSFKKGEEFFKTITKGKITHVTPTEALLAKLMKNMFSYIQNAAANELYLICESYQANIHKILEATNAEITKEVPDIRSLILSLLPSPNPNNAGPGMHKEGWFLVDRIPFSELITTSFKINESIPAHIAERLENYSINKVCILGMANKPNSDDPRSSLSYKLRKLLYYKNYTVSCYDPYLPEYSDSYALYKSDAVILMTAHKDFEDLGKIKELVQNEKCIYIDLQGFWQETRTNGKNGILIPVEQKIKPKKQT